MTVPLLRIPSLNPLQPRGSDATGRRYSWHSRRPPCFGRRRPDADRDRGRLAAGGPQLRLQDRRGGGPWHSGTARWCRPAATQQRRILRFYSWAGPAGRPRFPLPLLPAGSPVGSGVRASQLPGTAPRELGRRHRSVGPTGSVPIDLTCRRRVKSPTAALPPSWREEGSLPSCSIGELPDNDRRAGPGGAGAEPVDLRRVLSVDTVVRYPALARG